MVQEESSDHPNIWSSHSFKYEYEFKLTKLYLDKPESMERCKKSIFFRFLTILGVIPTKFKKK